MIKAILKLVGIVIGIVLLMVLIIVIGVVIIGPTQQSGHQNRLNFQDSEFSRRSRQETEELREQLAAINAKHKCYEESCLFLYEVIHFSCVMKYAPTTPRASDLCVHIIKTNWAPVDKVVYHPVLRDFFSPKGLLDYGHYLQAIGMD